MLMMIITVKTDYEQYTDIDDKYSNNNNISKYYNHSITDYKVPFIYIFWLQISTPTVV